MHHDPTAPHSSPWPTGRVDLVGRDAELRQVEHALELAASGAGQLLLISGETGVGKTALADAAVARARAAGMIALRGRCWTRGGTPPWWPWTQILRAARRHAPAGWPANAGELVPLLPELAADTSDPPPVSEAAPGRFRLYEASRTALAELAAHSPVVLVLDELEAASPAVLELLNLLAHELRTMPVTVIGAYRPLAAKQDARVDRLLAAVAREAVLVPLGGLDVEGVAALLRRCGADATAGVISRVHEATGGHPLLVTELARGLADGDSPAEHLPMLPPEGLRAAVRHWLEPLEPAARGVLAPAAVLGADFEVGRLWALVGAERSTLLDALGAAIEAGILAEAVDRPGWFRFRQPILQEAVLADLPAATRAALHLRAAGVIEERHAADLQPHLIPLARHYALGVPDDVGRALEITVRAARRAHDLHDLDMATGLWRQAVNLAERGSVTPDERCELLLNLGDALARAGDNPAARAAFEEAARAARSAEDDERFARAVLGCGGTVNTPKSGPTDGVLVDLLGEALARIGDDRPALRSALLGRLAMERYYVDSSEVRDRLTIEAVSLAKRSGERAALGRALNARHYALWSLEDAEERLANATEILGLAREANDVELALQAHAWRIVAYLELGDGAAVDHEIAVHGRLADALAQTSHRWRARVFLGMRALLQGRFREAERHLAGALELGARLDPADAATSIGPNARMIHGVQLFTLRREQGRLHELAEPIGHFAETYPNLPVWRCAQALVWLHTGRWEEAAEIVDVLTRQGLSDIPKDANWLVATTLLAEVVAGLGDAASARLLHELLLPHESRVVVVGQGVVCRPAVAYHLGLLAATAGDLRQAATHHERALTIHDRLGARPAAVRTRLALAGALRALGADADDVVELLRTAQAAAAALGMDVAARAADRALADPTTLPQDAALVTEPNGGALVARLRREGDRWTIVFDGRASQLRDAKGLSYLATLLAEPGVDHPSTVLERRAAPAVPLDRAAARRRFAELQEDLAVAEQAGDLIASDAVRRDMASLAAELTGARAVDRSEQARVNVTRAIRTALRNIAAVDAGLAEHLSHAVRTGASCSYRPDPRTGITWHVEFGGQAAS